MNLLESAGFSRSNPYYIVKQGKVGQPLEIIGLFLCKWCIGCVGPGSSVGRHREALFILGVVVLCSYALDSPVFKW